MCGTALQLPWLKQCVHSPLKLSVAQYLACTMTTYAAATQHTPGFRQDTGRSRSAGRSDGRAEEELNKSITSATQYQSCPSAMAIGPSPELHQSSKCQHEGCHLTHSLWPQQAIAVGEWPFRSQSQCSNDSARETMHMDQLLCLGQVPKLVPLAHELPWPWMLSIETSSDSNKWIAYVRSDFTNCSRQACPLLEDEQSRLTKSGLMHKVLWVPNGAVSVANDHYPWIGSILRHGCHLYR